MSIYIDDFLLSSNIMRALKILKKLLAKKYKINDLGKEKPSSVGRLLKTL